MVYRGAQAMADQKPGTHPAPGTPHSAPGTSIRLIGIDVDGTLLDSRGEMPPANIEAIRAAVDAGIHVALVTGRSYPWARPVADPLPSTVSLIVSSGAVERGKDGSTYARRLLDREVARSLLAATPDFRHSAALIFDRDTERQMIFETMDWAHPSRQAYWARNRSLIAQATPLEDALTEDPIQVMFNGGVETMRGLARWLDARANGFAVSLTEYPARDFSLIDVTSPLATKGRALAWRAAQLGLGPEQVMAVGDNYNDLEMLEFAGCAVVMANAVPELKERGWRVTGHQDAAGLAAAIRKFAL
jgi:Cof subfamily protein (haloacid dehalogenase superfamily)